MSSRVITRWAPMTSSIGGKRRWRHSSEFRRTSRVFDPRRDRNRGHRRCLDPKWAEPPENDQPGVVFGGGGGELRHFSWILWLGQLTSWCSQSPLFWGCLDCCCQLFLSNGELVRRNPLWRKGKRLWHSQVSASLSPSSCQNAQILTSSVILPSNLN